MSTVTHRKTSGNFLPVLAVSDCEVVGTSTLNELEQFGLRRPSEVEGAKARQMSSDRALKAANELRGLVQRRFDNARKKRATAYAAYIDGLSNGKLLGGTPTLTLFCPMQGTMVEGGIVLQHNLPLIAIDGETQTEARFIRRDLDPATGDDVVKFVLYHGIEADHAGSILHDANKYAHPITEQQAARLNANGSVTQAVSEVLEELQITPDLVKQHRGKPKKTQIVTWPALLAGAVSYAAPKEVFVNGGLGKALAKYNNGANAIAKDAVKPFLSHAISLAKVSREVATSDENVWKVVAAKSVKDGKLVSLHDWEAIRAVYNNAKGQKTAAAAAAAGI